MDQVNAVPVTFFLVGGSVFLAAVLLAVGFLIIWRMAWTRV